MGEAKPSHSLSCVLLYKTDRYASEKLAQVYKLLVPSIPATEQDLIEPTQNIYEPDSRDLRTGLLRSPKGAGHDCQPDGSLAGVCASSPVDGPAGMGI